MLTMKHERCKPCSSFCFNVEYVSKHAFEASLRALKSIGSSKRAAPEASEEMEFDHDHILEASSAPPPPCSCMFVLQIKSG